MSQADGQPPAVNQAYFKQGNRELYGLDAELAIKQAEQWDHESEKKAMDWISEMTGDKVTEVRDLKSGVALCKLANRIRRNIVPRFSDAKHPLQARANIQGFRAACLKLGVPSAEVFNVEDLYEEKYLVGVIKTIFSLARIATSGSTWYGPRLQVWTVAPSTAAPNLSEDSIVPLVREIGTRLGFTDVETEDALNTLTRERVRTLLQLRLILADPYHWALLGIPANLKQALESDKNLRSGSAPVSASAASSKLGLVSWSLLGCVLLAAGTYTWRKGTFLAASRSYLPAFLAKATTAAAR